MGGSSDNRHSIITKADFEPMAQQGFRFFSMEQKMVGHFLK